MEAPTAKSNGRRLTKEPPPNVMDNGMSPSRSLRSQNSGTLRRNPSAPTYPQPSPNSSRDHHQHQRTNSNYTSSTSSLERPSPNHSSTEFGSQGFTGTFNNTSPRYSNPNRRSSNDKSSDDVNNQNVDGSTSGTTMSTFESAKAPGYHNSLRRPPPPQLSHTSPDPRMLTPLRQSASFSTGDRPLEITPTRSDTGFSSASSKRLSGEESGSKGRWRKKSGISSFMNSVLGSPRNVKISNPVDPVHVTHVGYDNETGQFTVCEKDAALYLLL